MRNGDDGSGEKKNRAARIQPRKILTISLLKNLEQISII
jgi:hypothetical protein